MEDNLLVVEMEVKTFLVEFLKYSVFTKCVKLIFVRRQQFKIIL